MLDPVALRHIVMQKLIYQTPIKKRGECHESSDYRGNRRTDKGLWNPQFHLCAANSLFQGIEIWEVQVQMEIVVEGGKEVLSTLGAPRAIHDANDVHVQQKIYIL